MALVQQAELREPSSIQTLWRVLGSLRGYSGIQEKGVEAIGNKTMGVLKHRLW
ncbi:MAG: hypothetical protein KME42_24945 [Tildeniella nuda ZEHNDER 1965/U140]|jgi:ribosomal protein L5|nr:hypothetical protein [Tildeniella nuda ZEHNDER 1965/U140]